MRGECSWPCITGGRCITTAAEIWCPAARSSMNIDHTLSVRSACGGGGSCTGGGFGSMRVRSWHACRAVPIELPTREEFAEDAASLDNLRAAVSPVFFSTTADGSVEQGLQNLCLAAGKPVLLVGNHQTFPIDLGPLVAGVRPSCSCAACSRAAGAAGGSLTPLATHLPRGPASLAVPNCKSDRRRAQCTSAHAPAGVYRELTSPSWQEHGNQSWCLADTASLVLCACPAMHAPDHVRSARVSP